MSNKKNLKMISLVLGLLYVIITLIFVVQLFSLPSKIVGEANAYQAEVEKEIDDILALELSEIVKKIDNLKNEYPLEVVIEKKGEVIYQTLNLDTSFGYVEVLDPEVVLLETSGNFKVGGEEYHLWYSLYQPPFSYYLMSFFKSQIVLSFISFILLSLVIFIMQKILVAPLSEIKSAVNKLEQYDFDVGLSLKDDLRTDLSNFASKLDSDLQHFEYEHTKLGTRLEQKKADLKSVLMLSQGMVHELKTPLYQALHKAQDQFKDTSLSSKDILEGHLSEIDLMLKNVNAILSLLKNPEEILTTTEKVNVSELVLNEIKNQQLRIKQKDLAIEIELEEEVYLTTSVVALRVLIQNVILNAIQYAIEKSEISIELYEDEGIVFRCRNTSNSINISRMQESDRLLNMVSSEHKYSSGTGLFIMRQLSVILEADYYLETKDDEVFVSLYFKGTNDA